MSKLTIKKQYNERKWVTARKSKKGEKREGPHTSVLETQRMNITMPRRWLLE